METLPWPEIWEAGRGGKEGGWGEALLPWPRLNVPCGGPRAGWP